LYAPLINAAVSLELHLVVRETEPHFGLRVIPAKHPRLVAEHNVVNARFQPKCLQQIGFIRQPGVARADNHHGAARGVAFARGQQRVTKRIAKTLGNLTRGFRRAAMS